MDQPEKNSKVIVSSISFLIQLANNPDLFRLKKKKRKTQKREKINVDIDSEVLDQTRLRPQINLRLQLN